MNLAEPISQGMVKQWLCQALGLTDGETPFPWQEELLTSFVKGTVDRALDIPTGLGKTAVMAIWLVARACGADLPRRLVYVVDRRAVVDQATTEAERLRNWVEEHDKVKEALGLTRPLPISTLRGQHVDNREWLEDPASSAIIVGTVDMVGSRLLFEGYGVSRKMRPYHAGLLGADVLIVLDEAHLVPPFEKLLESIAENYAEFGPHNETLGKLVPTFKLLSLSATRRIAVGKSLELTKADLEHPAVKKRLEAKKCLVMKLLDSASSDQQQTEGGEDTKKEKRDLEDVLAQEAWGLAGSGADRARIIVFCDSREVAGKVKSAVEKLAKGDRNEGTMPVTIDTELFVGGRRIFEREEASKRLEELGFLAGSNVAREKPAFLFATSAAEVGVDLDADHMVCDLVAWERMVQRLGRVNRHGDGDATVVVEPEPQPNKKEREAIDKRNRGEELDEKERKRLETFEVRICLWKSYQAPFERLPECGSGRDASPGALHKLRQDAEHDETLRKILGDATTPVPLRPALTRALVDAWSLTSLETHTGRPAIDPWLRGWIEDDQPQTAVVWRKYLPVRSGPNMPTKKEIEAFFEAAPPHMSEILETETFRVLDWIEARAKSLLDHQPKGKEANLEGQSPGRDDVVAFVLSRDGGMRRVLRLGDHADSDDQAARKERRDDLRKALGGATLIVDARLAGLKDGLLDEKQDEQPRTADDGQEWLGDRVIRFRVRSAGDDEAAVADADWRERYRFAAEVSEEGEPRFWLIVEKWRHDSATEEDRSAARPQLLEKHQSWAEERARKLAERLGLDSIYAKMLAVAARLHDEGKRAKRWQRAFNAPAGGTYAKTKGPINYDLLDGYRHELGSLLYAKRNDRLKSLPDNDLRELALHLIAAHHGFARPVIVTNGCEDAPPSMLELRAQNIALRFARLQKRWGPWGLAWWEALLRAADQQASRDNDATQTVTQTPKKVG
jgi:CRISPR-associated endonuclease/helicase Cas3